MTKDKALQLPASRELDAIIAQKVMGEPEMTLQVGTRCPKCGGETRFCGLRSRCLGDCNEWIDSPYLCYSDEIEAAWQVVEKLKDHLPELVWRCGDSEPFSEMRWWCYFRLDQTTGPDCHGAAAESAPLAICRAAIKALWKD